MVSGKSRYVMDEYAENHKGKFKLIPHKSSVLQFEKRWTLQKNQFGKNYVVAQTFTFFNLFSTHLKIIICFLY